MLHKYALLGYIVPSGWQTGKSYATFRKLTVKTFALNRIINLPYDIFPEAYVDSTIAILEKRQTWDASSSVILSEAAILSYDRHETLTHLEEDDSRFQIIDYARWFQEELDPNHEFAFLSFLCSQSLSIVQKVAKSSLRLEDIADIQRGITPFRIVDQKLNENYQPGLDGEMRRYSYEFSGMGFVRYDKSIAEYKPPRYFTGPRIILRELISRQFRLHAIFVNEDFVTNKSYQSILLIAADYLPMYVLAILNSSVISHYHIQGSAIALRDDFPKIVLDETRNLPIPHITFTTPADERAHMLAEAQTRAAAWMQQPDAAATSYSAFLASSFGAWLDARLPASIEHPASSIEHPASSNQSDVIHDLLAHLAEEMLALNRDKQAERRAFLAWLERYIGAKVDDLTGKTDLQGYLGDYQKGAAPLAFDDLLKRLRQNRRKLTADPDARAFQETLEREYAASLATLLPLKQRLAATDRLIDLLVYRLYGLTEEEVEIVEGQK